MDACSIPIPTLETERLWLRPFRRSDLPDLGEMLADPEVTRGFGREPYRTPLNVWRFLSLLVGHWQLEGCGMWAVEEKATSAFLGYVGFSCPDGWPGFELAGAFGRRWWGQGYATESARAALTYAFEVMNRESVISLVFPENARSRRLIERLGQQPHCGSVEVEGRVLNIYAFDRHTFLRKRPPALVAGGAGTGP